MLETAMFLGHQDAKMNRFERQPLTPQQHPAKIQLISYSKQQAARQFLNDKPSKDQRCNNNKPSHLMPSIMTTNNNTVSSGCLEVVFVCVPLQSGILIDIG
jgi:hypothetical protein